jgi:hypothetical protein
MILTTLTLPSDINLETLLSTLGQKKVELEDKLFLVNEAIKKIKQNPETVQALKLLQITLS